MSHRKHSPHRSARSRKMLTALGAVVCVTLSACAGFSSGYSKNPDSVTYLTWEDAATNALLDKGFSTFPDKSVKVERINAPSAAYNQKLSSMTLAQKLPDFFWCNLDTAEAMGREGLLYNWSAYAKKKSQFMDPASFAPGTLSNWYINSKELYGIPTLVNTYGFFYNKSYFAKAHLALPTDNWTWDTLFTDIKKLKGVNGAQFGLQTMDAPSGFYSPLGISLASYGNGGQKISNKVLDATKLTGDSEFIAETKKFSALITGGYVTPPTAAASNTTAAFGSGKIGLMYGGQWLAPQFMLGSLKSSQWGFAPMPTAKRPVQPLDPQGVCSPSNIKNPAAVWKVITYLESHVIGGVLAASPVAPPAYDPAATGYYAVLKKDGATSTADTVRYEMETADKIPVRFIAPWAQRAGDVTTKYWNNILMGQMPLAKGIKSTFVGMQKVIDDKSSY